MIAGQSNAQGQTAELYSCTPEEIFAGKFRKITNDWVALVDPVDGVKGSVWPIVGCAYVNNLAAPIGFVPTAISGSAISTWLPGQANYEDMVTRALASVANGGTLKGVVWWQGEADMLAHTSEEDYYAALVAIAAEINTDLGVPLFAANIQQITALVPSQYQDAIRNATIQAWAGANNVKAGPDLSDLTSDDGYHIVVDAKVQIAASRWYTAFATHFGW